MFGNWRKSINFRANGGFGSQPGNRPPPPPPPKPEGLGAGPGPQSLGSQGEPERKNSGGGKSSGSNGSAGTRPRGRNDNWWAKFEVKRRDDMVKSPFGGPGGQDGGPGGAAPPSGGGRAFSIRLNAAQTQISNRGMSMRIGANNMAKRLSSALARIPRPTGAPPHAPAEPTSFGTPPGLGKRPAGGAPGAAQQQQAPRNGGGFGKTNYTTATSAAPRELSFLEQMQQHEQQRKEEEGKAQEAQDLSRKGSFQEMQLEVRQPQLGKQQEFELLQANKGLQHKASKASVLDDNIEGLI